jgi:hypothetical protein
MLHSGAVSADSARSSLGAPGGQVEGQRAPCYAAPFSEKEGHVRLLVVVAFSLGLGCAVPTVGSSSASLASTPLPPFALQFMGTYRPDTHGTTDALVLRSDETYQLTLGAKIEGGTFGVDPEARKRPLDLDLLANDGTKWSATIAGTEADLHVERGGVAVNWDLVRIDPRSDEDLCEATHGTWDDDDPNPATGLFCDCPASTNFIPAQGGCVTTPH